MAVKRDKTVPPPETEVRSVIAKLDPKAQGLFRAVRTAMRKRFPTANELAYDYRHSFVIGYSPTENGIDSILAISARGTGVFLYFSQGPKLPDPKKLLQGSAKMVRFVQLAGASPLKDPDVASFIAATIEQARIPFPSRGKGRLIFKSASKRKASPIRPATPPSG